MHIKLPRGFATFLLMAVCQVALCAEQTITCTLDDERSQQFCGRSTLAAAACERTYALDDAVRAIREVNPGRILPAFTVRSWSGTALDLVRVVEQPDDKVRQLIGTHIDRMNGRMVQASTYVDKSTDKPLTAAALDVYEAEQVKNLGLFGYLDRHPTTAICKAAQRAF